MPVKPQFEWEQTAEEVLLAVTIKGFRKEAVDVFVSDLFVKINAPPTYLLTLDLLHPIVPGKSTHHFDGEAACVLRLKLRKAEPGEVWQALCVNQRTIGKEALLARREEALRKAESRYNEALTARAKQQEAEKRRMTEAQWDVEKQQRQVIEQRVQAEKTEAEEELYAWEETTQAQRPPPQSPADILARLPAPSASAAGESAPASSSAEPPAVRQAETVNVVIDFTPKLQAMPTRSRGDDEYYRKSRYKPVSVEDSPLFWKERADKSYKGRDWKGAADAYSESIKRDGAFLTCVMNRAACYLQMAEYKKAIEDCTLALTMLANTPASEITQERYRFLLTKLHARRGAAHCWNDDLRSGVADLRMAAAYRDPDSDDDVLRDLQLAEQAMQERGIVEEDSAHTALSAKMQAASGLYYQGRYEDAVRAYQEVLVEDPYHAQARSNLAAAQLQLGQFTAALETCEGLIEFCGEVAAALNEPGAVSGEGVDSDDEEDGEEGGAPTASVGGQDDRGGVEACRSGDKTNRDDVVRKRRAAAKRISESSGHVYLLLKAYVRAAAALCGLKDYRKAHVFLEHAVRITPFDNDLRDDCNRLTEKIRLETLVAASTQSRVS